MQRAERQVSGFSDAQRRFDGLQVAHFADQHYVGVFTQGRAQRVGKRFGVGVQLALVDQAVLVLVHEFDGVFDGDDVFMALAVDLVDHRRQCGGFTRAGRAGHQNESAGLFAKLGDYRRQAQLRERLDLESDHAKHRGGGPALIKKIATEARQPFQSEREVEFQIFFEAMLLGIGEHAVSELLGLGRRQRRHVQRVQVPVHPDLRRRVGGNVQIAATHLQHLAKQITQRSSHKRLWFPS